MSVINVTNSTSILGTVRSIQLSDQSSSIAYLAPEISSERAAHLALTYSGAYAQQHDIQAIRHYLSGSFVGEMSLYRLQSMLNSSHWEITGLIAEVEFGISTTGHGDVRDRSHEIVLLVKTTWQES